MTSLPELFLWSARMAGVSMACVGFELVKELPRLALWRSGDRRLSLATVHANQLLAAFFGVLGLSFVVWPDSLFLGGAFVAVLVVFYFVVFFRPFGDGSDLMLIVVLTCLGTLQLMPTAWMRLVVEWCLAGNVCFAYWWSGAAKMRLRAWRTGRQIALICNSPRVGTRGIAWQLLDRPALPWLAAWGTMLLEVSCPLFLAVGGWPFVVWAAAAFVMHLSIAFIMGLGRFTWSFGAGLLAMLAVRL
ncbi:MAG: hypothetical protein JOZ47_21275 [Kutzneria sp.]|nr:hypothetical protein [Kutzneria sp.]MBV9847579.1 hypothetical protein [Kutzneria sp.]